MVSKSQRHNFSESVKRELASRVAYRCSKPGCDVSTVGPALNSGVSSTGIAAHITAASPGGPRYDPSLSLQERKSISNGIWLCATHGREIDVDASRYSVDELYRWKSEAEQRAQLRHGQPQPKSGDAVELLCQAASGQARTLLPFAIGNVHRATQQALTALDPRIRVSTSYQANRETYCIEAVSTPVPLQLSIKSKDTSEFFTKMALLREHGIPLSVCNTELAITGSPIMEALLPNTSGCTLEVGGSKRAGETSITLCCPITGQTDNYLDIPAQIFSGTKSGTIESSLFSGLIRVQVTFFADLAPSKLTFSFDFSAWEEINVLQLPNFQNIYKFIKQCADGFKLTVQVGPLGMEKVKNTGVSIQEVLVIQEVFSFLDYLRDLRVLAVAAAQDVLVRLDYSPSLELIRRTKYLSRLLSVEEGEAKDLKASIVLDGLPPHQEQDGLWHFPVVYFLMPADKIDAFGVTILLPSFQIRATHMTMQLQQGNSNNAVLIGTNQSHMSRFRAPLPESGGASVVISCK